MKPEMGPRARAACTALPTCLPIVTISVREGKQEGRASPVPPLLGRNMLTETQIVHSSVYMCE